MTSMSQSIDQLKQELELLKMQNLVKSQHSKDNDQGNNKYPFLLSHPNIYR